MANRKSEADKAATKILIVDDHPVVREGLAMHLASQPDLEVCGQADDIPGALALLASTRPDVAIIDISLRNGNGQSDPPIRERHDKLRISSGRCSREPLRPNAPSSGAQGYLNKGQATHHVLDAVRAILQGKVYVSGDLADQLLHRAVGQKLEERSPIDRLSDRELQAFQLIGEGMTTEAIAEKMHVSPKTVETFRARIKEKLGLTNMNELIHRAAQWVVEAKCVAMRSLGRRCLDDEQNAGYAKYQPIIAQRHSMRTRPSGSYFLLKGKNMKIIHSARHARQLPADYQAARFVLCSGGRRRSCKP